jgi:hypothetical protein
MICCVSHRGFKDFGNNFLESGILRHFDFGMIICQREREREREK